MFGEVVPTVMVDPLGTDVQSTLCVTVSLLVKITTVPALTVTVGGTKFSCGLLPTPAGMLIFTVAAWEEVELVVVDAVLVIVALVVDALVVDVAVVEAALAVDVADVVVVVEAVVVGNELVVVVVVVVEDEEPGKTMKYAAPAISITMITAVITAPVPIPCLSYSNFMPWASPSDWKLSVPPSGPTPSALTRGSRRSGPR